jgi:hypothetical protein
MFLSTILAAPADTLESLLEDHAHDPGALRAEATFTQTERAAVAAVNERQQTEYVKTSATSWREDNLVREARQRRDDALFARRKKFQPRAHALRVQQARAVTASLQTAATDLARLAAIEDAGERLGLLVDNAGNFQRLVRAEALAMLRDVLARCQQLGEK